jgi:transposase
MSASAKHVEVKIEEVIGLLERIEALIPKEDMEQLKRLVETLITLTRLIRKKGSTIARLRHLLGFRSSEKTADVLAKEKESAGQHEGGASSSVGDTEQSEHREPGDTPGTTSNESSAGAGASQQPSTSGASGRQGARPKGHGRIPASAYPAAEHIHVPHGTLHIGCTCPGCRRGKLYQLSQPSPLVRIVGQSPLAAVCWDLERLRCSGCGLVFTASLPPEARGPKYAESAVAMMALLRYDAGLPHNRLDRIQSDLETPLPSSTQWDVVSSGSEVVKPVYLELLLQGACGSVIFSDDTYVRILALMGERRAAKLEAGELAVPHRTGLFTTVIVSRTDHGQIALYFSGRNHAGENLAALLDQRATDLPPPTHMCDGLDRNIPTGHEVNSSNCLGHARRHVVDETESFPVESRYFLEHVREVFHNESICRAKALTDDERLELHQRESEPFMVHLEAWMRAQLEQKRVEPNSGMGRAINYMLKRWDKLTLFLRVPGAPLENNTCERAIKMAITHRKNSLFYRSERGALVGDIFMTIINTARLNGENPLSYLTAILLHAKQVAMSPSDWLPWTYRATLRRLQLSNAA